MSAPPPLTAIFFDFGNTLVFPDQERVLAPLLARGKRPSEAQMFAAERAARQEMDLLIGQTRKVDQQYWETYYLNLLAALGLRSEISLRLELVANSRKSSNWSVVLPGTVDLLRGWKSRYKLGLISNSDGGIARAVTACGLDGCFDSIIDSGLAGHEKPAPEIFQAGLSSLGVTAKQSVYIGDIYSVDYLGATQVGMRGILLDRCGAYATMPVPRVEALSGLEPLLKA